MKTVYLHSLHFILSQYIYKKIHKISLKTIFLVLLGLLVCSLLMTWTLTDSKERTLEKATDSCPWLKTGCGRSSPNRSNVCPCDLLIVIANESRMGN
jgi:hypothetical protein